MFEFLTYCIVDFQWTALGIKFSGIWYWFKFHRSISKLIIIFILLLIIILKSILWLPLFCFVSLPYSSMAMMIDSELESEKKNSFHCIIERILFVFWSIILDLYSNRSIENLWNANLIEIRFFNYTFICRHESTSSPILSFIIEMIATESN